ncbi:putative RNA polymerase II-associated RBA50 [Clavispora lusitaniae]|uniref:RNA polymerase II-associated RBA50 n=1 Tax=Clavispora lusitaniae TaxID=36911 RepID=A0ACD0WNA0_CLALS|nr:putative RNA polymerase II-associated RBA50 [Clavispora lusitaniae]QFZ34484.1 putative RNA polymerase II-associated RBA50 [Clavispora lusitaniae]QFZ40169.1 putative RNA polymerase II-associated RBA50 [Clavispora lusitaniae]QFZ45849.1 putative RNA polymerase II-associated RBA50 [Clavispora lusitaniae]QFZ51511.1 putative RNA polymerase II-associated RBA50 [Clavispora lusitaniae]
MDLIGEIVEHDVAVASPPEPSISSSSGFPTLKKFGGKRTSRFKKQTEPVQDQLEKKKNEEKKAELSEAEKINRENLEKLSKMSEGEIEQERRELLEGLDPKLISSLLKRAEDRSHSHSEGHDGWFGGGKKGVSLPSLSTDDVNKALGIENVRFADEVAPLPVTDLEDRESSSKAVIEVEDEENNVPILEGDDEDDEIAPEGYQILPQEEDQPEMHFPKPKAPKEDPDLDLNDPSFFDKLHEKYFADLPRETSKLAWMTDPLPQTRPTTYEAISDMRFDFKGELVRLDEQSAEIPTHMGLHHHSENPQLAGYTIAELVHLSRSVVPTQRCLGIQMLGRILHRLGLHKYEIMPIVHEEDNQLLNDEMNSAMRQFESMMWDLIDELRVIESLTEAADEKKTRNLSVRNYAIEALWLWKQGGGRPEEEKSEQDIIAEQLQGMNT